MLGRHLARDRTADRDSNARRPGHLGGGPRARNRPGWIRRGDPFHRRLQSGARSRRALPGTRPRRALPGPGSRRAVRAADIAFAR